MRKIVNYWCEDTIKFHAKECTSRTEFQKKYYQGYDQAKKLQLLEELFPDKRNKKEFRLDNAITLGKKCKNIAEFSKRYARAYEEIVKAELINDLFPDTRKPFHYWDNQENIIKAASECTSLINFRTKYSKAYQNALELGILNNLNLKRSGNNYLRCVYAFEFESKNVYVGLTYNYEKRIAQHLSDKNSSVFNFINFNPNVKYLHIKLSEYINKDECSELETKILNNYLSDGWNKINISKTGGLGSNSSIWTIENALDVCKKYNNYKELINSVDKNAYYFLYYKNMVNKIIYKNNFKYIAKRTYTKESVLKLCSKHRSRKDLIDNGFKGAYDYAWRNKFIEELKFKAVIK